MNARRPWLAPYVATLFAMLALQMSNLGFSPLLPSIRDAFHMNFAQMGLFAGMYGLLSMLWSVPAGLLAKRFGEKVVLAAGLGHGSSWPGGAEPGSKFRDGVRGPRPLALRIPLLVCVRDGGRRADISAIGAWGVHGNPGRDLRARVRDRRTARWSDWTRLWMEKRNPCLRRGRASGTSGVRCVLPERA